jgi:hypothetical protein
LVHEIWARFEIFVEGEAKLLLNYENKSWEYGIVIIKRREENL